MSICAMQAVIEKEKGLGFAPEDVQNANTAGTFDRERLPVMSGLLKGKATSRARRQEQSQKRNSGLPDQARKFILAIVLIDGKKIEGPFYLNKTFDQESDFGMTSINYNLGELLTRGEVFR